VILRVGLLVVGLLLCVFLSVGAVQSWSALGAGESAVPGETPTVVEAVIFTFFALFSAAAAVAGVIGIARMRRRD
jgi:hypothetical protein